MIGEKLDHYQLTAKIGEGGMAARSGAAVYFRRDLVRILPG